MPQIVSSRPVNFFLKKKKKKKKALVRWARVGKKDVTTKKKKDVTKGHASNYVAIDPSHGGMQPARKVGTCGGYFTVTCPALLHMPAGQT
jgi:N-acetylmuramoyl-L-alanine amidase